MLKTAATASNNHIRNELRARAGDGTPGWSEPLKPTSAVTSGTKIVDAQISKTSAAFPDGRNVVQVRLSDGRFIDLFTYYPDELQFVPEDFIGSTVEAARKLRHDRDVDYLRTP